MSAYFNSFPEHLLEWSEMSLNTQTARNTVIKSFTENLSDVPFLKMLCISYKFEKKKKWRNRDFQIRREPNKHDDWLWGDKLSVSSKVSSCAPPGHRDRHKSISITKFPACTITVHYITNNNIHEILQRVKSNNTAYQYPLKQHSI